MQFRYVYCISSVKIIKFYPFAQLPNVSVAQGCSAGNGSQEMQVQVTFRTLFLFLFFFHRAGHHESDVLCCFFFFAFVTSSYVYFLKKISSRVSIKTYAYCHIALHISILYSWVGSYSWEPLIFVIKLKHKLIHWVY